MKYCISCFMPPFCLVSFFFFIYFCSIDMAEQHFKFLLNFPVSCYCSFESGSSGSLFVLSLLYLFFSVTPIYYSSSFDHLSIYLLTLAPFLLLLFLFLCSYKSFMLTTFWPFLHQREISLVKSSLNCGHVQRSKVHFSDLYSFSFLGRFVFQSKHESYISTLFISALCIEVQLMW